MTNTRKSSITAREIIAWWCGLGCESTVNFKCATICTPGKSQLLGNLRCIQLFKDMWLCIRQCVRNVRLQKVHPDDALQHAVTESFPVFPPANRGPQNTSSSLLWPSCTPRYIVQTYIHTHIEREEREENECYISQVTWKLNSSGYRKKKEKEKKTGLQKGHI